MEGVQREPAFRGLATRDPLGGRFDAVVDGVADQMGQRVADGLDDAFVEFGVLPFHVEAGLFAAGDRKVSNHARELVPDGGDGLHACLHDACLQFRGQQVQPLHGALQGRILPGGAELNHLIAGQDQLADQIHQLVDLAHVHANRATPSA